MTMHRVLWALFGVLALVQAGCGEVKSCERGAPGCIEGPVDNSIVGGCRFGLVANAQGNCIAQSGGSSGDNCNCPSGALCNSSRQCVNVCELPTPLPVVKPQPRACRPKPGQLHADFVTAAVAACSQACIRRGDYCGIACDPATFCTPAEAQRRLMSCNGDISCATLACEQERDRPCAQTDCSGAGSAPGAQPNCAGVVCSNTCPTAPEYLNDGLCDDGDLSNAGSAACDWGTDCGDCGPRRGTAPRFDRDIGELCVDPVQCGGDTEDVRRATGWCVRLDLSVSLLRCVTDCSTRDSCPSGFTCEDLKYDDNGVPTTLVDDNDRVAKACFPALCGN
jgi:hypothetical protein